MMTATALSLSPSVTFRSAHVRLMAACIAAAGLAALPPSAFAQQSQHKGLTLGLGAAVSDSPYRDYDQDILPVPIVSYEGERFYFRGLYAGYKLIEHNGAELSLVLSPYVTRFRPKDSSNPQLRQLSSRDFSGLAGVAYRQKGTWGDLQVSGQQEITGHGSGQLFDASYSYPLRAGSFSVIPQVGASLVSEELVNYYYGVSNAESVRSGLRAYRGDDALNIRMGVTVIKPLGGRWVAMGSASRTWLDDEISRSPMIDSAHMDAFTIGLSKSF